MRPHVRLAFGVVCASLPACGGAGGGGAPLVPTGLFVPASAPASWTGLDVRGMAARDRDGDGIPDLVLAHLGAPGLSSSRGLGDGHFEAPVALGAYPGAAGLELTDLDGDAIPEALVLDFPDALVWVGDGNPDGSFDAATGWFVGAPSESLAVGDVNGDAELDLVAGTQSGVPLWLGTIGTAFTTGPDVAAGDEYFVALADVDEDGDLDVLTGAAGLLRRRFGNGDGTFGAPFDFPFPAFRVNGPLALGDLNGDGHVDVVACRGLTDEVGVSLGDGAGGFTAAPVVSVGSAVEFAFYVTLAHLNGDAHLDLLVAREDAGEVHVFHGAGDGTFVPRQVLTVGPQARALLVADLNVDGAPDLLVACISGGGTTYAFLGTRE
jgi:hypothetical protein